MTREGNPVFSNIFTQPTILRMEMRFLEKQDSSLTLNISLVRKTILKSGERKLPELSDAGNPFCREQELVSYHETLSWGRKVLEE